MFSDSEGLGTAVVAGVGSNLTQPSGILYFSLYNIYVMYNVMRKRKSQDPVVQS